MANKKHNIKRNRKIFKKVQKIAVPEESQTLKIDQVGQRDSNIIRSSSSLPR